VDDPRTLPQRRWPLACRPPWQSKIFRIAQELLATKRIDGHAMVLSTPPSLYSELLPRFGGALFGFLPGDARPVGSTRRTPKNRYGIYIRCMLIERMRKRLYADRTSFIEPCLPSPADKPPSGSNWIHIKHDGHRLNLKVFSLDFTEQIIAEHPACPSL
jgi:hypothetical protein